MTNHHNGPELGHKAPQRGRSEVITYHIRPQWP